MLFNFTMPLPSDDKKKIIEEYAVKKGDTGSPEVQVALLSERVAKLVDHLKQNKKDNHSRAGLLKMVGKRRKLLGYLQEHNVDRYRQLLEELNIRK